MWVYWFSFHPFFSGNLAPSFLCHVGCLLNLNHCERNGCARETHLRLCARRMPFPESLDGIRDLLAMAYTKDSLQHMAGNGRQTELVTYSYSGIVGAGAVEGRGYSQRSKAGVTMVVWMAAFANPKGQSLFEMHGVVCFHGASKCQSIRFLLAIFLTIKLR